jgi:Transposase, Mutator family
VSAVIEQLEPTAPKVSELLEAAEADLLAFYRFAPEHWSKLRSTNPLERVNREIGRRTDVVGIFPNDASLIRLAGMLLIEQNDEWLVSRRYLAQESLAALAIQETELSVSQAGSLCPECGHPGADERRLERLDRRAGRRRASGAHGGVAAHDPPPPRVDAASGV